MKSRAHRIAALLAVAGLLSLLTSNAGWTDELIGQPVSAVATGQLEVCWKSALSKRPDHVIIHFHGAAETLQAAFQRSDLDAVLVIVNFPGLSSAYSQPFANDGQLFEEILERAEDAVRQHAVPKRGIIEWKRVTLSSFSAGYGAVREILKTPKYSQRVDDIVAADSIYAGLQENLSRRQVDEANMQHFRQFARLAADGKKSFTISHSSQPTPYASTTETADYLLRALQMERQPDGTIQTDALRQRTLAKRGQFSVFGFHGTTGKQHLQHLHHIDLLWNQLPIENVAVVGQAVAGPADATDTDFGAAVTKLESAIRHEVEQKQLPAFSISLVDDNRTVWADGFGFQDADRKQPATAETVYRVGSVSKLFTDIAVLQLVEEGKLDLDAPIQSYLPEFQPHNPHDVQLTLRQLMSHRSGLVRESPVGNYFDPDEPTLAATVASLNKTSLVYPPETRTKYSNAAIAVVGSVLEKQLGASHPSHVQQRILEPLRMSSSSFEISPAIKPKLATGWMRTYDGRRFEAPTFLLGTGPAGNLYSNVIDLSRFLVCLFNEGKTADGEIISPETFELMSTPIRDSDGKPQGFGLGFHVQDLDGHKKIGHGGAIYGFSTQFEALPERKLGVAAASSLDGSNGIVSRLADYALRLMIAAQDGNPLPEFQGTGPIPKERARELTGMYREVEGKRFVRVTELNGEVVLRQGVFQHRLAAARNDGRLLVDDAIGFGTEVRVKDGSRLVVGDRIFDRLPDVPPANIPDRWKGLIGEYGWDHNTLYILEDNGQLFALIEWFYYYPLTEVEENVFEFPDYGLYHGEGLKFARNADGIATEVLAAEVRFARREVGTKDGETFQIKPVKPIDELRAGAMAATPPPEPGDFRETQLVDLVKLDDTIKLDIRYATTNNFTGSVFYKQPRAFMQRPAADAVVRANKRLKTHGLGLLVHDAYRPWHVTKMFWDATPDELKDFVANPANGSRHNRGCAVDLTLYDLESGEAIRMVAGYDEFSPRSFPTYPGGTSRQRWYRELLRRTMEAEGFTVYEYEWWHFDYQDWNRYPIGNVPFEEIPEK